MFIALGCWVRGPMGLEAATFGRSPAEVSSREVSRCSWGMSRLAASAQGTMNIERPFVGVATAQPPAGWQAGEEAGNFSPRDTVGMRVTSSKTPQAAGQRRQTGGARHEASERVVIRASGFETSGWTLNVSRGGIRAIFEDPLTPETEYEVSVGSESPRRASIAWSRQEADGQIVGLRFLDVDGSIPPEEGSPA